MKKVLFPILILMFTGCLRFVPEGSPAVGTTQLTISTFNASPSPISPGGTSTLTWNVPSATTVTIDQGIGNVALSGNRTVTPTATTIYTLTATNASGTVATATTQVVVSAGSTTPAAPESTPPSPPSPSSPTPSVPAADLPVVNYFTANPPFIIAGSTTTLSWNVSDATTVTIDQGVGNVSLAGTAPTSPPLTANYTLTATNAAGWNSVTITVVVGSAPPPADKPDLVIQDISRSGSTIYYKIRNQGTATSGASISALSVDGVVKAYDSVGPLNAGAISNRSFATYTYSCSGISDTLAVNADKDNVVVENNEGNNSYSKSWTCLVPLLPLIPILPLGKPDLIITDIWESGDRIHYRIKNQGTLASVASTSQLYVNAINRGPDSVPSIAAGASLDRVFTYVFSCFLPMPATVEVRADISNSNTESDEGNNNRLETITCH